MYNYRTFNPHTIREKPLSESMEGSKKPVWYEEKYNPKTGNYKPNDKKINDNER